MKPTLLVLSGALSVVACAPTPLEIRFQHAVELQKHAHFDEAILLYRQILGEDQEQDGVICNIGLIHLQEQRFHHATEYFRWAIGVNDTNVVGRYLFARSLLAEGKPREALRQVGLARRYLRNAVWRQPVRHSTMLGKKLPWGANVPDIEERLQKLRRDAKRGTLSQENLSDVVYLARHVEAPPQSQTK